MERGPSETLKQRGVDLGVCIGLTEFVVLMQQINHYFG